MSVLVTVPLPMLARVMDHLASYYYVVGNDPYDPVLVSNFYLGSLTVRPTAIDLYTLTGLSTGTRPLVRLHHTSSHSVLHV